MEINIEGLLPEPIADRDMSDSDLWERSVGFLPGERILLKADSGSGKTSFLSILYGIRKDYRGKVRLGGRDIRSLAEKEWSRIRREELGMVFQDLKLFEELSVRENIRLKNRLTEHCSEDKVLGFLEQMEVADQWEKAVGKLSMGQKQRVAIARGLCQPFRFLLLDEPFSHLDEANLRRASELIEEELKERGAGLLLSSLAGDHQGFRFDRTLAL